VAVLQTSPEALAQADAQPDAFKLSGSVRVRAETIDGQARAGLSPADTLFDFRARLLGEVRRGWFSAGGEVYDSRVLRTDEDTPVTNSEVNTLELVQAYVGAALADPWGRGSKVSAQVGRFTLNLGSRRLVSADDFRNTTNGYTGLRVDAGFAGGVNANVFYVLPQMRLPADAAGVRGHDIVGDRESADLQLFGAFLSAPFGFAGAALQPSYVGLRERDRPDLATRDRRLDTFGLRYFRDPAVGKIDFDVEAMTQHGELRASSAAAAARLDVDASYWHAEIGRRWAGAWKPRIGFEYDYASGDEPGGDYRRFDTLFGMRRSELAPSGFYNSVGRANIAAFGVRVEVEPSARWEAFVTLKRLELASATDAFSTTGVADAAGASGDFAGIQLDQRVRYWLVPQRLRLEANIVHLQKGRFLREAPNVTSPDNTDYVALDLTYSF